MDEHEILALEEFRKLVLPANEINYQLESVSSESAEHLFNFLEGKSKQIPMLTTQADSTALTYADLKKLFERILTSSYWKKRTEPTIESGPAVIEAKIDEITPSQSGPAVESSIISNQINQLDLNVDAQSCNQKHQHHNESHPNSTNEQGMDFLNFQKFKKRSKSHERVVSLDFGRIIMDIRVLANNFYLIIYLIIRHFNRVF